MDILSFLSSEEIPGFTPRYDQAGYLILQQTSLHEHRIEPAVEFESHIS
jgi:hypothetical protein